MPRSRLALAVTALLWLPGCDDAPAGGDALVRSQCGFRLKCVYRGVDAMAKGLEVESGKCEADVWPGGCFALLPMHPVSKAEREQARAKGHKGLPVSPVCH